MSAQIIETVLQASGVYAGVVMVVGTAIAYSVYNWVINN